MVETSEYLWYFQRFEENKNSIMSTDMKHQNVMSITRSNPDVGIHFTGKKEFKSRPLTAFRKSKKNN